MDTLFDRQLNILQSNLNAQKQHSDTPEHAKELTDEQIEDLLFDVNEEAEYFLDEAKPYYERTISDFGNSNLEDLDLAQTAIDFDLDNPRVNNWLDGKEQQFAQTVNNTTWRKLKDELMEGNSEGEGIPGLAERVEKVFDDAHANRSQMIARTEVNGAANFGAMESYKQSGVVERKQWLAALDERTRFAHANAHTQKKDIDKMFDVGGEKLAYPGDPSGSAGNVINCRCTTVPITERTGTPENIPNELNNSFDADGNFDRESHKQYLSNFNDGNDIKRSKNKYEYTKEVNHQINRNILAEQDLLDDSFSINISQQDGKYTAEMIGKRASADKEVSENVYNFIKEFNDKNLYDQLNDNEYLRTNIMKDNIIESMDNIEEMKKARRIMTIDLERIEPKIDKMREALIDYHKETVNTADFDNMIENIDFLLPPAEGYEERAKYFHSWLMDNVHEDMMENVENGVTFHFSSLRGGTAGQYSHANKAITVDPSVVGTGKNQTTYIHEMLHAVHEHDEGIKDHVRGFFADRTEGLELEVLDGFESTEGYNAGFMKSYMGRVYARERGNKNGTEILSKGVEFMHRKEGQFFRKHLSEFNTVLSIMRGLAY